ncbi:MULTISPECIES: RNA polymerase sigma factor [Bacteroides]|jgi:RNA polymerase sigma factor, sigma-70 family|uniref:Sigma-70 family RNA polymerase sigma factor n=1 Tax=Bacteroides difficilis TaxID=2763021 RepID=A0ABR7CD09_9BACE|nr:MULTISPECIES: sigma-70 family RNA polymerase sigma factor [Bacteroides]MBC5605682.1 sigma-70 family RNA polymerase sigma factor [Bacteroides difficilis]
MKILDYIRKNNRSREMGKEIENLYELYKQPFILFAISNYPISKDTAIDIYQESFTAMYQNIRSGKYTERNVSLKTYLFEIGKHHIFKYINKEQKENDILQMLASEWNVRQFPPEEWNEAQKIVSELLEEADTDCNKVLILYYWERRKMEEIARYMNYKTEQVAKNKKSSCLRRLSFELKRRLESVGIILGK